MGYYNGLLIATYGVVIYHGLGFYIVTHVKQYINKFYPKKSKKWYMDFLSGAIGGLFGQISFFYYYIFFYFSRLPFWYYEEKIAGLATFVLYWES